MSMLLSTLRTILTAILVIGVGFGVTQAQDSAAPFGLQWGASSAEVKALGVGLAKVDLADYGQTYSATSLPKTLSDVDTVFLSFGHDDKLWRVAVISREFERDGYGSAVRSRYDELKATLSKRYGRLQGYETLSTDDFYRQPDNFIYGIFSHENGWGTTFDTKELSVELSIGASGPSDAFWRIIYEDKALEAAFQQQHSNAEADAL